MVADCALLHVSAPISVRLLPIDRFRHAVSSSAQDCLPLCHELLDVFCLCLIAVRRRSRDRTDVLGRRHGTHIFILLSLAVATRGTIRLVVQVLEPATTHCVWLAQQRRGSSLSTGNPILAGALRPAATNDAGVASIGGAPRTGASRSLPLSLLDGRVVLDCLHLSHARVDTLPHHRSRLVRCPRGFSSAKRRRTERRTERCRCTRMTRIVCIGRGNASGRLHDVVARKVRQREERRPRLDDAA